jgi:hypothetical protein
MADHLVKQDYMTVHSMGDIGQFVFGAYRPVHGDQISSGSGLIDECTQAHVRDRL